MYTTDADGNQTDANTWHLYAYCAGNPISYMDPTGNISVPAWLKDLGNGVKDGFVDYYKNIPKAVRAVCKDPMSEIKSYFFTKIDSAQYKGSFWIASNVVCSRQGAH